MNDGFSMCMLDLMLFYKEISTFKGRRDACIGVTDVGPAGGYDPSRRH